MTILCDLDGVLVNSTETWLREYRAISGDPLYPEQLSHYAFDTLAKHPKLIWTALTTGDVFRTSTPYDGAVEAVRHLVRSWPVYFVTYSHESVKDGHRAKLDWVRHWLPFVEEHQVVFTKHKQLVQGAAIIEDSAQNVSLWLATHPSGLAYLVDQPYNKGYSHPRCVRVKNMWDVVKHLEAK